MPKFPTYPTLYDNCKTVSVLDLKRWEYLKPNQFKSGVITWGRDGNKTGSISIAVNTNIENPYLELDYQCNETSIKYRVQFILTPSNLGKGVVWLFVCPRTGKRCRKLYLGDTYFYHRSAFRNSMYEKQTHSHKNRKLLNQYGKLFGRNKAFEQIYSKHFKKLYNGKSTKRYSKLLKQIEEGRGISEAELLFS